VTKMRDFTESAGLMLPIALSTAPFGLLLGSVAADKGLTLIDVLAMSGLVFAGSSQFVAVSLWDDPLPWVGIALSVLLVNARHIVMGASLARSLGHVSRRRRLIAAFFMADEVWALAERRARMQRLTMSYYAGLAAVLYVSWLFFTGLGTAIGAVIADPAALGFDFAFTAVFIALIVSFVASASGLVPVIASAAAATVVHLMMPGAVSIMAGTVAGLVAAMAVPGAGARSEIRKSPEPGPARGGTA
jgi:4-azaleucine resistance transporter AzlC